MDIQTLFYLLAILYLLVGLLFFIFVSLVIWRCYRAIKDAPQIVKSKLEAFVSRRRGELVLAAIAALGKLAIDKLKKKK